MGMTPGLVLADPEALGDDVLESCLYILRDRLQATTSEGGDSSAGDLAR
jgi:hypothetical protein